MARGGKGERWPPSRRRSWTYGRRVERVVAHIGAHLDAELDLAALAEVACLSPHHFPSGLPVPLGRDGGRDAAAPATAPGGERSRPGRPAGRGGCAPGRLRE